MLLFLDGQAHYGTAELSKKYSMVNPTGVTWSVTSEGRFGNCIKRETVGVNNAGNLAISPLMTRLGPWAPKTSGVCGFAVKVDDLQRVVQESIVVVGGTEFFSIVEGSIAHVGVILNPDGTFSLWRSRPTSSVDLLAVSSEGLQSNAWAFVEFKWLIHETTGRFEIRANGVTIMDFTGNTRDSAAFDNLGVWNSVHLLCVERTTGAGAQLILRMCDLYLADLTTSAAADVSDFLGDGTIETIMPDSPGAAADWTPNAGPNWDMTDDRPVPDNDATYITATPPGLQDLYNFEDILPGSIVRGVHWNLLARKTEEGSGAVAPVYHAGSDFVGPIQGVPSIAYDRYLTQPYDFNPATGAAWTSGDVNAGQWGVRKMV